MLSMSLSPGASSSDSPTSSESYYDASSKISLKLKHGFNVGKFTESESEGLPTREDNENLTIINPGSSNTEPPSFSESGDLEDESDLPEDDFSTSLNNRASFDTTLELPPITNPKRSLGSVQLSQLVMPKSKYFGYTPPLSPCNEKTAVFELLKRVDPTDSEEFIEFQLSDFAIYLPENVHQPFEMRGLQLLTTRTKHSTFLFDGVLSFGTERRYVQGVPFKVCSIGNYGEEIHMVGSQIWIQSDLNTTSNIYYRLETPSPEYRRFHDGFLWIANLGKHFVDFCEARQKPVSTYDFHSDFANWLRTKHWESIEFQEWYKMLGSDDFRRAVSINITYLFKESIGVNEKLGSLPIWNELLYMDSIPKQETVEEETIVTPFVYECFREMRLGHHLKVVKPSEKSESRQIQQENALDLSTNYDFDHRMPNPLSPIHLSPKVKKAAFEETSNFNLLRSMHEKRIKAIKNGDVLSVTKDGEGSVWKDEISRWKAVDDCWYIYVQRIHIGSDGKRSFDALWLYKPSDTSCAKMKYPFRNELFLSDNCTCRKSRITEDEVLDIVPIKWYCQPSNSKSQLFIRQTYLENEKFVTLKESHKMCEHLKPPTTPCFKSLYPIGQTVLAPPRSKTKHELEIYEVDQYISEDTKEFVMLRQLRRRMTIDGRGKPNELVYTDKVEKYLPSKIHSKCLLRFYTESEVTRNKVPAPYCRDGTGNAFYITSKLVESDEGQTVEAFIKNFPKSLIQGFNPLDPPSQKPLRGMDLYSGSGNLGRGLEEGGAVENEWAVDINQHAIHTYAANLKPTDTTRLWYGSVNDLLLQALEGNPKSSKLIPQPGDVDLITAGSPCQGFSLLNDARNDNRGLKNQSMVASVAAYIDFYRPKYGLLENVMSMAQKGCGRDEDVLSQLICAIVGMGYQLQIFVLDAWSCGGPQSRTRLFVSFAAPGMEPLEHPALSHSHPRNITDRGLGKLANGQPFGRRIHTPTAFEFVNALEATKDLPRIGDGITYQCTQQPDHVIVRQVTQAVKRQIEAIPIRPRGMNFCKAYQDGKGPMTKEQREAFPSKKNKTGRLPEHVRPGSQAWGRVDPRKLFSLICQSIIISDSRMGPHIHWDEHRTLTLMEGRRIQGFPDDEVMLAPPNEGWKRLGNSVSRQVSLALGLSLREAWLKNEPEAKSLPLSGNDSKSAKKLVIANKPKRCRSGILLNDSATNSSSSNMNMKGDNGSESEETEFVIPDRSYRNVALPADFLASKADSKAPSSLESSNIKKQSLPTPRIEISDSEDFSNDETFSEGTLQASLTNIIAQRSMIQYEQPSMGERGLSGMNDSQVRSLKRPYSGGLVSESQKKFSRPLLFSERPQGSKYKGTSKKVPKVVIPSRARVSSMYSSITSKKKTGLLEDGTNSDIEIIAVSKSPILQTYRSTHAKSSAKGAPYTLTTRPPVKFGSRNKSQNKATPLTSLTSSDKDEDEDKLTNVKTSTKNTPVNGSSALYSQPKRKRSTYMVSIPNTNLEPNLERKADGDEEPIPIRRPHDLALIRPPPAPYQPQDNSAFNAYEQSHKFLKLERNRKHGPVNR